MSKYVYRAWDASNSVEEGELEATSVVQAVQLLESRGLRVESISQIDLVDLHLQSLPSEQQNAINARREAALANAHRWAAPLRAFAQEEPLGRSARSILQIATKLEQARNIEELAADPQTAELLPVVLHSLASDLSGESVARTLVSRLAERRRWRIEWLYPAFCFLFCLVLLMLGSRWIVSTFQEMYEEFGLTLPPATLLLLSVNRFFFSRAWFTVSVIGLVALVALGLYLLDRIYSWRLRYAPRLASGSSSALKAMSVITQNVAELIELNYPTGLALRIAGRGCRHPYYRKAVVGLAQQSELPIRLESQPLDMNLPPLFTWLLSRDDSPNADSMRRLAQVYRQRHQYSSDRLALALSQAILIFTGLSVAFTLIALFMPLVKMITSLA